MVKAAEKRLPGSAPEFSAHCSSVLDDGARRCLTLIKPARRDPKRILSKPILLPPSRQSITLELFWETESVGCEDVESLNVSVFIRNGDSAPQMLLDSNVANSGVCEVHVPRKMIFAELPSESSEVQL